MPSARDTILTNIRRSLRRDGELNSTLGETLESRLTSHPEHIQPAYEQDPVERLIEKLEQVHTTVDRVSDTSELPSAIKKYIAEKDFPDTLLVSADLAVSVDWPDDIKVDNRPANKDDTAALSSAYAAVAENGTLVLLSAKATPTSHNFLPDDHIVVVKVSKVFRYLEDVWEELRMGRGMPRAVNLITGPSKTADVEQTIQYGAHGPRRLHVVLVDE